MEKLGRIRDAASDSSSVSSLGDLRSTDLMPSDCAWGVCMNLRQRKSLVARRETRSRGDLNFAQMHLIIAHAVRGRYAQRCACYGRWMRTTCAGRSMRGTPTCTRTAALVAGEATGANALQAFANSAHATSRTRAIIAVFMCFTACLYRQAGSRVWSSASMRMYYNPRPKMPLLRSRRLSLRKTGSARETTLPRVRASDGPRPSPPTSPRPQPSEHARKRSIN